MGISGWKWIRISASQKWEIDYALLMLEAKITQLHSKSMQPKNIDDVCDNVLKQIDKIKKILKTHDLCDDPGRT